MGSLSDQPPATVWFEEALTSQMPSRVRRQREAYVCPPDGTSRLHLHTDKVEVSGGVIFRRPRLLLHPGELYRDPVYFGVDGLGSSTTRFSSCDVARGLASRNRDMHRCTSDVLQLDHFGAKFYPSSASTLDLEPGWEAEELHGKMYNVKLHPVLPGAPVENGPADNCDVMPIRDTCTVQDLLEAVALRLDLPVPRVSLVYKPRWSRCSTQPGTQPDTQPGSSTEPGSSRKQHIILDGLAVRSTALCILFFTDFDPVIEVKALAT